MRILISAFVIHFLLGTICKLATSEISIFLLVSVDEETCLKPALSNRAHIYQSKGIETASTNVFFGNQTHSMLIFFQYNDNLPLTISPHRARLVNLVTFINVIFHYPIIENVYSLNPLKTPVLVLATSSLLNTGRVLKLKKNTHKQKTHKKQQQNKGVKWP